MSTADEYSKLMREELAERGLRNIHPHREKILKQLMSTKGREAMKTERMKRLWDIVLGGKEAQ